MYLEQVMLESNMAWRTRSYCMLLNDGHDAPDHWDHGALHDHHDQKHDHEYMKHSHADLKHDHDDQ